MDAFEALAARRPATETFTIAVNADDAKKLDAARLTLARAKSMLNVASSDDAKVEAAGAVDDAEAALNELIAELRTFTFHLAGIGPDLVEELLNAHPPTKDQKAKTRKANGGKPGGNQWNDDTFPPALIAATLERIECSDPDIDDVTTIDLALATGLYKSKLSVSDKSSIFLTALGLDQRASSVGDLGNA